MSMSMSVTACHQIPFSATAVHMRIQVILLLMRTVVVLLDTIVLGRKYVAYTGSNELITTPAFRGITPWLTRRMG